MATVKVTEVIGIPADREAFEAFDWDGYFQQRRRLPGLERLEVARVVPPPDGGEPTVALLSEGWFRDLETLQHAHGSDAGKQVRTSVAALREITSVDIHVAIIDHPVRAATEHGTQTAST